MLLFSSLSSYQHFFLPLFITGEFPMKLDDKTLLSHEQVIECKLKFTFK